MVRESILRIICNCEKGELEKVAETNGYVSGPSERFRVARIAFYECDSCKQLFERTEVEEHHPHPIDVIPRHGDYIPYKGKLTKQELKDNANKYTAQSFSIGGEEEIIAKRR